MADSYTSDNRVERLKYSKSLTTSDNFTFAHNLGYIPFIRAWALYPNGVVSGVSNNGPRPDTDIEITLTNSSTQTVFTVFDGSFTNKDDSVVIYLKVYTEALA